jgi:hypothetical protein
MNRLGDKRYWRKRMIQLWLAIRKDWTIYKSNWLVSACVKIRTFFIIFNAFEIGIVILFVYVLKKRSVLADRTAWLLWKNGVIDLLNRNVINICLCIFRVLFSIRSLSLHLCLSFHHNLQLLRAYRNFWF